MMAAPWSGPPAGNGGVLPAEQAADRRGAGKDAGVLIKVRFQAAGARRATDISPGREPWDPGHGRRALEGRKSGFAAASSIRSNGFAPRFFFALVLAASGAFAQSTICGTPVGHVQFPAPEAPPLSVPDLLLALDPATVTAPLAFSGPVPVAFALLSQRAFSWTGTRYAIDGANVTDSYQPGRSNTLLDAPAISEVTVCTGFDIGASRAFGAEVAAATPSTQSKWHGTVAASGTGSFLSWSNLPGPSDRGALQQTLRYRHFTRNSVEVGGPAGKRIDWFGSLNGQWALQTVPLAAPGQNLNTRLLTGLAAATARLTARDQLRVQFIGTAANLSDFGTPAGIEAWLGRRMAPSFTIPSVEGFAGAPEKDSFGLLQGIWSRTGRGDLQVRAAASWASLDTIPSTPPPSGVVPAVCLPQGCAFLADGASVIDLATGATNGVAPITNRASRTRQSMGADYQAPRFKRNSLSVGAEWERAAYGNRFGVPGGIDLIANSGAPAYVVQWSTPADNGPAIQSFTVRARDLIAFTSWLSADLALVADSVHGGSISWTSASPRLGFAIAPFSRLRLSANYNRLYAPLAGRYLDYGDPNSLSGLQYQWNQDVLNLRGPLIARFGGQYSSIDPGLRRPYADEFNVGAEARLPWGASARALFFRRDDKARIAAVNSGVPVSAFTPTQLTDPGPDGIPGTYDDQRLTVYAQNPATFGQDQYLLTNPPGLRMMEEGVALETGLTWRAYGARASLTAEKAYGPSNPGNAPEQNDSGVVGALFTDPNAGINASGRQFFDRAYVGKMQFFGMLPKALGAVRWQNAVNYLDGVAFARELVVSGLPQGPILIDATMRGSPGGGNRAEHVLNWNLRLSRDFPARRGAVTAALDILNLTNNADRIREADVTGLAFNQRLPIEIPPGRTLRLNLQYAF